MPSSLDIPQKQLNAIYILYSLLIITLISVYSANIHKLPPPSNNIHQIIKGDTPKTNAYLQNKIRKVFTPPTRY